MEAAQTDPMVAYIGGLVSKAKAAQKVFERTFKDQRAVDEVVRSAGLAVVVHGNELSQLAVDETGMGNIQGKLTKMNAVALKQWNFMKGKKSVGYLDNYRDEPGVRVIAKPMGVIGCVMPSTNPIATIIANTMMSFKCRNAVIIAPHPASASVSIQACEHIRAAVEKLGLPADLIQYIDADMASINATKELMRQADVNIATGGAAMVKSAYSSGRPSFGVGQGNCQAIIDEDFENMQLICSSVIGNRSYDNGVPCTSEQTMLVPAEREEEYLTAMRAGGAYVIEDQATADALRALMFPEGGTMLNRKIVGRPATEIGEILGLKLGEDIKAICVKNQAKGSEDVLCLEVLCPLLRYTTYTSFEEAVDIALANLEREGAGHSSSIWSNNQDRIEYVCDLLPVGRIHINQSTLGLNSGLPPTTTIGCGSWGNNSISENLEYYHLMNTMRVTVAIENRREVKQSDWDDYDIWEIQE